MQNLNEPAISQIELDAAIERAEKAEAKLKYYLNSHEDVELVAANEKIDELEEQIASFPTLRRFDTGLSVFSWHCDNLSQQSIIESLCERYGWRELQ